MASSEAENLNSGTFRIPQSAFRIFCLLFFALRVPQIGQDGQIF
jgi:hypothetical protein